MAIGGDATTVYRYTPTGSNTVTIAKRADLHDGTRPEPEAALAIIQRGEAVTVNGKFSGALAQLLRAAGYTLVQR